MLPYGNGMVTDAVGLIVHESRAGHRSRDEFVRTVVASPPADSILQHSSPSLRSLCPSSVMLSSLGVEEGSYRRPSLG